MLHFYIVTFAMSKIVFILWVSGSWKWVIVDEIIKLEHISYVSSYVTRAMRPWEVNWRRYNFISKEEFEKMIQNWEFLEYEINHHAWYYWTKLQELLDLLKQNKSPVKEIDVKWLEKIKSEHKIDSKFTSIFFDIPDELMIKRITWRSPISKEELKQRLLSAHMEREKAKSICDYIIMTDGSLEENVERVRTVLDKELNTL